MTIKGNRYEIASPLARNDEPQGVLEGQNAEGELADIEKKKQTTDEDLEKYMAQLGVEMNRLKSVEGLAQALKKAEVSDSELEDYLTRQQMLDKSGISLSNFAAIVEKANVFTSGDHGKGLLNSLSEYIDINEATKDAKNKLALLEKQVLGIEQLAQQKGKLTAEVAELKAEKATLKGLVDGLQIQKKKLDQAQSQFASLVKKNGELEQEIAEKEKYDKALALGIKAKEQKVSDLGQLEEKHDTLAASVSKLEARLDSEEPRLQILDSLLGLVQSSSIVELEKFLSVLPTLLDQVKRGQYSTKALRSLVLKEISGDTLQVLKCVSCGARFNVDIPATSRGYHCPRCDSFYEIITDQEEAAFLKEALAELKPQIIVAHPIQPDKG